jgi:hypothetical protein
LLRGRLAGAGQRRRALGFLGGVALPIVWIGMGPPMVPGARRAAAILALIVALGGELAERRLFFAAAVRPKMPGGMGS